VKNILIFFTENLILVKTLEPEMLDNAPKTCNIA